MDAVSPASPFSLDTPGGARVALSMRSLSAWPLSTMLDPPQGRSVRPPADVRRAMAPSLTHPTGLLTRTASGPGQRGTDGGRPDHGALSHPDGAHGRGSTRNAEEQAQVSAFPGAARDLRNMERSLPGDGPTNSAPSSQPAKDIRHPRRQTSATCILGVVGRDITSSGVAIQRRRARPAGATCGPAVVSCKPNSRPTSRPLRRVLRTAGSPGDPISGHAGNTQVRRFRLRRACPTERPRPRRSW
jgi:hypothetical protein